MDISLILNSLVVLAQGTLLTLALTLLSLTISFVLSVPLSLLRASDSKVLSGSVLAYTYVFRGTPLMVQLFLVYYGLSQLDAVRQSIFWPILREPFLCALMTFSLNSTAYTTEVFRAGIQAVPRGVIEAAKALGLSRLMQIRLIIFPLAFRTVLPSYANEVVGMIKASSLASTVTLLEVTGLARRMVSETFAPYEVFLAAGLIYLLMNFIVSTAFRALEIHLTRSAGHLDRRASANWRQTIFQSFPKLITKRIRVIRPHSSTHSS